MDRRVSILAVFVAALFAASGCQDYNFNPVGHCLIQPGTKRVTLSDVATADVLFVVDDSGSMGGEQAALGTEFPRFLDLLARANKDRVNTIPAQEAVDFHIAVTTTAAYYNEPSVNGSICSNLCPGALGQYVCCLKAADGTPSSPQPPLCVDTSLTTNADCGGPGSAYACKNTCAGLSDVNFYTANGCCDATNKAQPIACDRPGEPCGIFDRFYYDDGLCTQGYGQTGRYPAGRFMADTTNASPNDTKVLHFTKTLPWSTWAWTAPSTWGGTDPLLQALATAFDKNVRVGTCGSPQEQGLEAARRAIKAQLGQDGLSQPGVAAGDWLHSRSKLVVVWVSDEDDCSAPYSAADGVVFPLTYDGCVADSALPLDQQRQYRITEYADYFTSLGRPFGAAFIASANNGCSEKPGGTPCVPLICSTPVAACCPVGNPTCTPPPGTCGGQGVPTRYLALAAQLRAKGVDVVTGSICDAFGDSLGRIAKIVKPPDGLVLPTQPAASDVSILRIARPDGSTRKTCSRPAEPPSPAISPPSVATDLADPANVAAQAYINSVKSTYDWWFTETEDQITPYQKLPAASSKYVFINHSTLACEASPGETYSLDYIGQLPGACPDCNPPREGGCITESDCTAVLGGKDSDWACVGYVASPERRGTCTCQ
jgi:hypothetical protein